MREPSDPPLTAVIGTFKYGQGDLAAVKTTRSVLDDPCEPTTMPDKPPHGVAPVPLAGELKLRCRDSAPLGPPGPNGAALSSSATDGHHNPAIIPGRCNQTHDLTLREAAAIGSQRRALGRHPASQSHLRRTAVFVSGQRPRTSLNISGALE